MSDHSSSNSSHNYNSYSSCNSNNVRVTSVGEIINRLQSGLRIRPTSPESIECEMDHKDDSSTTTTSDLQISSSVYDSYTCSPGSTLSSTPGYTHSIHPMLNANTPRTGLYSGSGSTNNETSPSTINTSSQTPMSTTTNTYTPAVNPHPLQIIDNISSPISLFSPTRERSMFTAPPAPKKQKHLYFDIS